MLVWLSWQSSSLVMSRSPVRIRPQAPKKEVAHRAASFFAELVRSRSLCPFVKCRFLFYIFMLYCKMIADMPEHRSQYCVQKGPHMRYLDLYEKAVEKANEMSCPACESTGTLMYADAEVLVCNNCQYSIDAIDLQSEWQDKLEKEDGFYG